MSKEDPVGGWQYRKQGSFNILSPLPFNRSFGWIGVPHNFRDSNFKNESEKFCEAFNVRNLFVLEQVHSSVVVSAELLDGQQCSGDGIVLRKNRTMPGQAFGIRTADCLPVFIETNSYVFLLHGGWRGVADGILNKAIQIIGSDPVNKILIGPAACKDCYEVGEEVIASLSNPVVSLSRSSSTDSIEIGKKFLLDLPQTAMNFLVSNLNCSKETFTSIAPVCSIEDKNWHSHRRDKDRRGANLLFYIRTAP